MLTEHLAFNGLDRQAQAAQARTPRKTPSPSDALAAKFRRIDKQRRKCEQRGGSRFAFVLRQAEIRKSLWDVFYPEVQYTKHLPWPRLPDTAARKCLPLIADTIFATGWRNPAARVLSIFAEVAAWLSDSDRDAIMTAKRRMHSAVSAGRILGLTKERRKRLGIKTMWPIDGPRTRLEERRRQQDAERKQTRRTAKKTETKTDRAVAWREDLLRYRPMPAGGVLQIAALHGFEKPGARTPGKVLRNAAKRLGIERTKMARNKGWSWGMPKAAERAKTPCLTEGALICPQPNENPLKNGSPL